VSSSRVAQLPAWIQLKSSLVFDLRERLLKASPFVETGGDAIDVKINNVSRLYPAGVVRLEAFTSNKPRASYRGITFAVP